MRKLNFYSWTGVSLIFFFSLAFVSTEADTSVYLDQSSQTSIASKPRKKRKPHATPQEPTYEATLASLPWSKLGWDIQTPRDQQTLVLRILSKTGRWIQLFTDLSSDLPHRSLFSTGVSQALWVAVMYDNPSYFKNRDHCWRSHLVLPSRSGEKERPLCPDLPVDSVPRLDAKTHFDETTFYEKLNALFSINSPDSSFPCQFTPPTLDEYQTTDTDGGRYPKVFHKRMGTYEAQKPFTDYVAHYYNYGPFHPLALSAFKRNPLGFARSGVWEPVGQVEDCNKLDSLNHESQDPACTLLTGGAWNWLGFYGESGYVRRVSPASSSWDQTVARLTLRCTQPVRTIWNSIQK
jgi:hypothetical protein